MDVRKTAGFFVFAALPLLAGLYFASQTKSENHTIKIPLSPGIIFPGNQESGALSIVPAERGKGKIEYRKILFGWGKEDRDKDRGMMKPEEPAQSDKADQGELRDRDSFDTPGDLDRSSPGFDGDSSVPFPSNPGDSEKLDMGSPSIDADLGRARYMAENEIPVFEVTFRGHDTDLGAGALEKGSSTDQDRMVHDRDKSEEIETESRTFQTDQLRFIM